MVTVLTLMYWVFGNNIVLSIVVLTFIIRIAMYPLLSKQQDSAKKMQEVQPKLKKIQEKYKDDREKLSQAQMELYKEAGVNPFGGCLPMLVQFPIFIALYRAIFFALAATPFQLVDLSERLLLPGLDGLIPLQNVWLGMHLTAVYIGCEWWHGAWDCEDAHNRQGCRQNNCETLYLVKQK